MVCFVSPLKQYQPSGFPDSWGSHRVYKIPGLSLTFGSSRNLGRLWGCPMKLEPSKRFWRGVKGCSCSSSDRLETLGCWPRGIPLGTAFPWVLRSLLGGGWALNRTPPLPPRLGSMARAFHQGFCRWCSQPRAALGLSSGLLLISHRPPDMNRASGTLLQVARICKTGKVDFSFPVSPRPLLNRLTPHPPQPKALT